MMIFRLYYRLSELVSHCKPRARMSVPPGAIAMDGAANATSRNTINMFPRAASLVLRQSHTCSTGPSSSESDESVSLVYATNLDARLGVVKDIESHHHWTDFSSIWISPSRAASKPTKNSLLVCWYPKHVKFDLPVGDVKATADELCRKITLDMARQHLASGIAVDTETLENSKSKGCKEAIFFVDAFEQRMQKLSLSGESVFPSEMSDNERQSVLAKLSDKTGFSSANIRVQPFAALFGSDDECVKCCEYNLMAAFHNFFMTRGGCVFCPTADFAVQQAKKPNVHGCDLELFYGMTYCTHMEKGMQWQMAGMLGGLGGGNKGSVSSKDCNARLA